MEMTAQGRLERRFPGVSEGIVGVVEDDAIGRGVASRCGGLRARVSEVAASSPCGTLAAIAFVILLLVPAAAQAGRRAVLKGTSTSTTGITTRITVQGRWDVTRTQLAGVVKCGPKRYCVARRSQFSASYDNAGEFVGVMTASTGVACVFVGLGDIVIRGEYACEDRFGLLVGAGAFSLSRRR